MSVKLTAGLRGRFRAAFFGSPWRRETLCRPAQSAPQNRPAAPAGRGFPQKAHSRLVVVSMMFTSLPLYLNKFH
jgi:hypothetical protein